MNVANDMFTYHTVEALQAYTLSEVEALWELVPTERQRLYRAAYERTRRDAGAAGSDALEEAMLTQLLARYTEKGLVPVGAYWVPTPSQLQAAARSDTAWSSAPLDVPKSRKVSPIFMIAGACCGLVLVFLLVRGLSGNKSSVPSKVTAAATPTAILARTYTPTPLALDAQDAIIQGGSAGGGMSPLYPVNLRIAVPDVPQARLFVVQHRVVTTAEWNYDNNPDVASYLVGLMVHPVLGIPWSDANAELFHKAGPGTMIALQMNTGAVQRFVVTTQQEIGRGDTTSFAQDHPGLTLVLLGQKMTDEEMPPTDRRLILIADYAASPEDSVAGMPTVNPPTLTVAPTARQRIDVDMIQVTTQPGHLSVRLRVFNGQTQPLTLDEHSIWLTYGYSEQPAGPHVQAELQALTLAPYQAADVTVIWAWNGEPYAVIGILDVYQYSLTLK